ncbi:hypothetical protein B9Z19DRAFT_1062371 [Tuber borchii]|uniref:Uncharacterized protein n=1 Tax=Tuber borchii TaxID=42251 RepID=A0A2T7A233_TUBBO|nr:hypothetical protein B9Z19DRAFT_1062371 [Tuber borchii]
MSIISVSPSVPRRVRLPRSADEWKPIINKIVPTCDIGGDDLNWKSKEAIKLENHFPEQIVRSVSPHCECCLIEYLRTRYYKGKLCVTDEQLSPFHTKRKYQQRIISQECDEVVNVFVPTTTGRQSSPKLQPACLPDSHHATMDDVFDPKCTSAKMEPLTFDTTRGGKKKRHLDTITSPNQLSPTWTPPLTLTPPNIRKMFLRGPGWS